MHQCGHFLLSCMWPFVGRLRVQSNFRPNLISSSYSTCWSIAETIETFHSSQGTMAEFTGKLEARVAQMRSLSDLDGAPGKAAAVDTAYQQVCLSG